jgi:type II secretory ATPase GspE/PulE/Tfp pilus assembly ATPase PilB-like protein
MKKVLGRIFFAYLQQQRLTESQLTIAKGAGCAECNDTGYTGRVGIFEVLPVTEKIGRLILERRPAVEIERQAMADGMILMKQDGYLKVLEKATTIEEVLRVAEI